MRYAKIKREINKLTMTESRLRHRLRQSRTRTLIQIGGLVSLTPLLDFCDIVLGEDLQSSESQHKANLLLGILNQIELHNINIENAIFEGAKRRIGTENI